MSTASGDGSFSILLIILIVDKYINYKYYIRMKEYNATQYVELFHLLFLDQLGRKLDKRFYALKGSCNLRLYLKSFRFSEDAELDVVPTFPKEKLQDKIVSILDSIPFRQILQIHGIRIDRWTDPKQTETTQRWKLMLAGPRSDLMLPTKIEFSRRGMDSGTVFEPVDASLVREYHLSPIMMNHYDAHAAYEQKIEALITRTTTQARDIFDLNLLLNTGVDRSISNQNLKIRLHEAQTNAFSIPFDIFKSQVLSYLRPEYREQYDSSSVWESVVLNVVEAIGEAGG